MPVERTLKNRVTAFWDWYETVGERFLKTIDDHRCGDLTEEVCQFIDDTFPGMAWVFGPGTNGGHSFTLSGEGMLNAQLVARFWLKMAREIPGWTFHCFRPANENLKGHHFRFDEFSFKAEEIWLAPLVREDERIDLTVWHPLFQTAPKKLIYRLLSVYLDEALGEVWASRFLASVSVGDSKLRDSIPLTELRKFLEVTIRERRWKEAVPGDNGTVYRIHQPGDFPRGDIFIGTTLNMHLINRYLKAGGQLPNPLPGLGADFIYICFDGSSFPKGDESGYRMVYEAAIDEALQANDAGIVLGGAFGRPTAYIDIMLYDGETSIEIIRDVLKRKPLPAPGELHYFDVERRGHRVVLG